MRVIPIVCFLTSMLAVFHAAEGVETLPVIVDMHGSHQLTEKENFQRIMKEIGADKDPTAPPVGDTMTTDLLAYLSQRLHVMDRGDVCYILRPIADLKFTPARSDVLAFMARNGVRTEAIYGALEAIGRPEDAVVLAKAVARRQSKYQNTKAEGTIEVLAGEDTALWRQVAAVNDPYLQALAVRHLAAGVEVSAEELAALFKAGSTGVRRAMLGTLAKQKRTDVFPVLLLAVQDRCSWVVNRGFEGLKMLMLSDAERHTVADLAERLHRKSVLHARLTAARLAALLGDPRGFDWALECLQDFADSGQKTGLCCGIAPRGVPGEGPMVFIDYDRSGFANFLRLVKKGEKREALRAVAFMMSVRANHEPLEVPLNPSTEEMQGLRRGLEAMGTDLSREILATVFKPVPKRGLPKGLSEEQVRAALDQKVGQEDFTVEVGRRPFDKPDVVEFRLKKTTPGDAICAARWEGCIVVDEGARAVASRVVSRGVVVGGRRGDMARVRAGETVVAGAYTLLPDRFTQAGRLMASFEVRLPDGRELKVAGRFTPDQLRLDPACDVEEFLRLLNSGDPKEVDRALPPYGTAAYQRNWPEGEARKRIVQAIAKKSREAADIEPPPSAPSGAATLAFGWEGGIAGNPLAHRCMAIMDHLGVADVPEEDFLALLDAKDCWAARWAYDHLRQRWRPPTTGGWEGVNEKMIRLLCQRAASKNPYTARNAAILLSRAVYPERRLEIDFSDLVRPLVKSPSPMVRAAGALLARVNDKFDCCQGTVLLHVGPLVDEDDLRVARAAMIGLAECQDLFVEEKEQRFNLFRRLADGGDPARMKVVAEALRKIEDPAYVPLLYRALRATGDNAERVWLSFPLDREAAGFLLDRLDENPSDRLALKMLLSSGYVWPPDTRVGRLQKQVRDFFGRSTPVDQYRDGAALHLLTADKDDRRAAEALAAAFKKHLRGGDYQKAGEDCLALAALGLKTRAPLAEAFLAPDTDLSLAALLAIYLIDRPAAREPLADLLRESERERLAAVAAFAQHTEWPDLRAVGQAILQKP